MFGPGSRSIPSYARRQSARSVLIPAPLGGWDVQSPLADMPRDRAVILDNWFPGTDKLRLRRGSTSHATIPTEFTAEFSSAFTNSATTPVETLLEYIPPTGTGTLFAAAGSTIWDATTAGSLVSTASVISDASFVQAQHGTPAGHFLFAANGVDDLLIYNGTDWAASTITGVTLADVAWVSSHQKRLWLGTKDSLDAYYLTVEAVTGAVSSFSLASVAKLGGYLMGMGTWTRDGGDGSDDVAVFLTSEGEAILYRGTDPSSASTWELVGVFRIGKPLSRRSMTKSGSDLVVATDLGIVPLSRVLTLDPSVQSRAALSNQIDQALADAVTVASGLGRDDEWQVLVYPAGQMLLVNVPRSDANGGNVQFVFNSITGAPCRFTGWNARCLGLLDGNLYYGGAGKVVKADTGTDDEGSAIVGDCMQAFSELGTNREKSIKRIELIIESNTDPDPSIDVMMDYRTTQPTALNSPSPDGASLWGTATWGSTVWGTANDMQWRGWRSVNAQGRSVALRVRVNNKYGRPTWVASHWLYVPGGLL